MGQSLTHLLVHAIFSTKDRRPFLRSEEIREIFKRHRVAFEEGKCPNSSDGRPGWPWGSDAGCDLKGRCRFRSIKISSQNSSTKAIREYNGEGSDQISDLD
jgi:hypothetical protein